MLHVIVLVIGKKSATQNQFLEEAVCISLGTNALGKSINLAILLQLWVNNRADWDL